MARQLQWVIFLCSSLHNKFCHSGLKDCSVLCIIPLVVAKYYLVYIISVLVLGRCTCIVCNQMCKTFYIYLPLSLCHNCYKVIFLLRHQQEHKVFRSAFYLCPVTYLKTTCINCNVTQSSSDDSTVLYEVPFLWLMSYLQIYWPE